MALNRDKYRKIVGGITTTEAEASAANETTQPPAEHHEPEKLPQPAVGQGSDQTGGNDFSEPVASPDHRRFAMRGRPKGRKDAAPASKARKVKVSLFLSEYLINDFYDWAHEDKMQPGEMIEKALKPFHEKEAKRRKGGKE